MVNIIDEMNMYTFKQVLNYISINCIHNNFKIKIILSGRLSRKVN